MRTEKLQQQRRAAERRYNDKRREARQAAAGMVSRAKLDLCMANAIAAGYSRNEAIEAIAQVLNERGLKIAQR